MITLGSATKVHLLAGVTDMRRGFEGLFALARALLEADPLSGHVFGFCNRGRNRLKLLYWDGSGLWICAKRLERGSFSWPSEPTGGTGAGRCVRMTQAELTLLLSGIDMSKSCKRDWYRVDKTADTQKSGPPVAAIMSVIASAQRADLNIRLYLSHCLEKLADRSFTTDQIHTLLPENSKPPTA